MTPDTPQTRLVAAPHPFRVATVDRIVPDDLTLADMLHEAQCDPVLAAHAHIWIGDQYIPRDNWRRVRPKAGAVITLRVVPQGGGGGGKNPMRTMLTIAVIVAAMYAGPAIGAYMAGYSSVAAANAAGASIFGLSATAFGQAITGLAGGLLISAERPA